MQQPADVGRRAPVHSLGDGCTQERVVEAVRLYTVADAAEHLGMSRGWLYGQIRAGRIRFVELGDTRAKQRIRADDLQAFIDDRTHGQAPRRDRLAAG
jgi:excisionase family DNA binding protein